MISSSLANNCGDVFLLITLLPFLENKPSQHIRPRKFKKMSYFGDFFTSYPVNKWFSILYSSSASIISTAFKRQTGRPYNTFECFSNCPKGTFARGMPAKCLLCIAAAISKYVLSTHTLFYLLLCHSLTPPKIVPEQKPRHDLQNVSILSFLQPFLGLYLGR